MERRSVDLCAENAGARAALGVAITAYLQALVERGSELTLALDPCPSTTAHEDDDEDDDVPEDVWAVVTPLQERLREEHAARERARATRRWWRRPRDVPWVSGTVGLDPSSAEDRAAFALAAPWSTRAEVTHRGATRLLLEYGSDEGELLDATTEELTPFQEAADRTRGLELWERDLGTGVREVELHVPETDADSALPQAIETYLDTLAARGVDVRLSLSCAFVGVSPLDVRTVKDEAVVGRLVDQRLRVLPWWRRMSADREFAHLDPGAARERELFCRCAGRSREAVVWTTGRRRGQEWWRADLEGWVKGRGKGWMLLDLIDGADAGWLWFVDDTETAPFDCYVV